ncbi:hypothetical protein [Bradyrhizobium arachidis]|nr:hypothetical protein [Bradyrhizobium arachidis]
MLDSFIQSFNSGEAAPGGLFFGLDDPAPESLARSPTAISARLIRP